MLLDLLVVGVIRDLLEVEDQTDLLDQLDILDFQVVEVMQDLLVVKDQLDLRAVRD